MLLQASVVFSLFIAEKCAVVRMYHSFSVRLLVLIFGLFLVWKVMNTAV